jgi:predicted kinase
MRKWMRDRLQRRKKTPAGSSDQPAPPPLQPAYFEANEAPATDLEAGNKAPHSSTERPDEPDERVSPDDRSAPVASPISQEPASEAEMAPTQTAARESTPAGRSRRRRGGRGRGGRGREQAVAQAFAPAAVKGSISAPSAEATEEGMPDATDIEGEAEGQARQPAAAPALKSPATPAPAQRPPKGVVVLAIGLPGSGKSSWFKRHNVVPLSSDMVRSLLFDDVREQRFQDLVFSNLRSMLKARLIAKRPTNYVDATNLTPQERQHWIKLAKDYQYEVHAVFFDVPLEVCVERHQRRDRVVPEDVMRRMAAKLKAPSFEEGFAKITVVRVKKKDSD